MKMLKNKLGFSLALAALAMPMMVSAQVATTPVVPSTSTSGLIVSVTTPTTVNGGSNVNLATIRFDATGLTPIMVSSIPVLTDYLGTPGAVTADDITNCRIINTANGVQLNTGNNVYTALFQGSNNIRLDSPLVVNVGTPAILALNCDVTARAGGSIMISVPPTGFAANSVLTSNGTSVTPTAGVTASGTVAPTSGTIVFTGSGSTPTTPVPPVVVPTTPGLPNTGMGGNAAAVYALIASLAVLATGGFLMRREFMQK
jgi:hypothetical protein